ncbi:23S rRNA (cytosine1962-C5)-methyltransferase [Meinhardsimonia xiamenensis]|jgi:23S rRNA (cytosine1962-C5)-methyltransferase|uniref:23S rRNA (Cytosine1962-C5)-methyltransferase n=1 Tax=Meinhardsimonia xiamenensis TaxID=990712 RepID=A0A1G9B3W0_9RHOB|nr:class I SAM-dependent rRNA methyltransferase [Meinhardsimonia xiamenensis]PRX35132.1 23S rRNA (cytosine1962-C5)-methyltransferase [Meinhardsimonia xiamenensis]SDK34183.1 23S rRNA (cytosine1962-C5)-methyltransferase [Meinhardsimonia xiamenensis]
MSDPSLPVVRLRPKSRARDIRHGHPWAYADDLVLDRRTRALPPGSLAVLEDSERNPLGLVAVNPASKIAARLLDRDSSAEVGPAWFAARLSRAQELRARLYPTPHYRLVHAEADGLPGVVIDRFGEAAVIQPNAAWADRLIEPLTEALVELTGVETVVMNGMARARRLEGLENAARLLRGVLDGPVEVPMNGAVYLADLMGGQKTGLYYDQRDNHAFAARLAGGGRVLDVFSHVGGFALAALVAGATEALAIDGSQAALDLAARGAEASGVADRLTTRRADAFEALAAIGGEGARFDLVICDPPAFAPSRQALERGLRAYERLARLAAPLVSGGGFLVLCSCSHAADLTRFSAASIRGIGRAGRAAQLLHVGFAGPDHPQLPQLAESGYLKALFFRLD